MFIWPIRSTRKQYGRNLLTTFICFILSLTWFDCTEFKVAGISVYYYQILVDVCSYIKHASLTIFPRSLCQTRFHYQDDIIKWKHFSFFALLAICAGNSPVSGEFPAQVITEVKQIVVDFSWDGKLSKIADNVLVQSIEDGGLKLVDFESKVKAAKIVFVKRLLDKSKARWKASAPTFF